MSTACPDVSSKKTFGFKALSDASFAAKKSRLDNDESQAVVEGKVHKHSAIGLW
jgi:hypothetical protein